MCTARKPEIGNLRGLGNGLRKRSGYCKSDNFGASVGFPPFRRPWKLEIQEIQGGFGNGHRKRSGYCKVDNFGAFVGFPLISAVLEARNPRNTRSFGNGHRERSGYCKIDNFGAFVEFPPFRRPQKPEIQEIQGALEMAFGKGYCKIDDFGAFAVFPSFRRPCMEAGNPRNPRGLGNGLWKRSGYCKIGNFSAFVVFRPFGRPWKPEIQDIQGALEMATGKGAGNAKSTILVLLLCSPHFGGFGSRKSIGSGYRKRSGCCKIDNFGAFVEFPPFRRP